MPELPEVEITRRGIEPYLKGQRLEGVVIRQRRLRWPVPKEIESRFGGQVVECVRRRAKYLLFHTQSGTAIMHLGMSGSLRVINLNTPPQIHDHVDLILGHQKILRLRDPRRFGALLWCEHDPLDHPLLKDLGPEPLGAAFDGDYLVRQARGRRVAVKAFIMNSRIVSGVGNIYANEALFKAGIHPRRAAARIGLARYQHLADGIKQVLQDAIAVGGTTLRDFLREDGTPGYFRNELQVYGRAGEPCPRCGHKIRCVVQGQRSTHYCPGCQH
jgi:formamidopyrimidine-DNA glycosylase